MTEDAPTAPVRYQALEERCRSGEASPRQAIKAMCLQCVGHVSKDVRDCQDRTCPLWAYRPYRPKGQAPF